MKQRYYTIYHKDFVPEALLTKYPTPAEYEDGTYFLFGETLEGVSGELPAELEDISLLGLQENDGTEVGVLTKDELDSGIDALMSEPPRGREIRLSVPQGKYLTQTRFAPEEVIL